MSFENLDLNDALLKAVSELGFVEPTPIQTEAIPEIISGERDLVGLAQTGTGKTAAFGLPMIQLIDFDLKHVQGLIVCPTRELCMQITKDIKNYCKYRRDQRLLPYMEVRVFRIRYVRSREAFKLLLLHREDCST